MHAVILLAHGSRNQEAISEIKGLAEDISEIHKDKKVFYAFLEMAKPSLAESIKDAFDSGATQIDVLPLLLNTGNHVSRDIPEIIKNERNRYPGVLIRLLKHFGAHPSYPKLVADMVGDCDRYVTG